jgi:hypothetical protein
MNASAFIVTQGEFDQAALQVLIPEELRRDVRFVFTEERSSAYSMATTLLTTRRVPVVLVVDADSYQHAQIEERRDFVTGLMKRAALDLPYLVIVMVPEFETLYLNDRATLERIANRKFSDFEWRAAQRDPKGFLAELGFGDEQSLVKLLVINPNPYVTHPAVRQIVGFLQGLQVAHAA